MTDLLNQTTVRRRFLIGASATGLIALSGCSTIPGLSFTDAVRRLLYLSSERAFARLAQDGGYWDQQVGRVGLETILGTRGNILSEILTSAVFKDQLQDAFSALAVDASERAAPIVADAVRTIGIAKSVELVRGGPKAATEFLRGEIGASLLDTIVPELGQAIRVAQNPVIGQALTRLSGVNVESLAARLSSEVSGAIWNEMGTEEAAIRRDPKSTNDPLIIGVFGLGGL